MWCYAGLQQPHRRPWTGGHCDSTGAQDWLMRSRSCERKYMLRPLQNMWHGILCFQSLLNCEYEREITREQFVCRGLVSHLAARILAIEGQSNSDNLLGRGFFSAPPKDKEFLDILNFFCVFVCPILFLGKISYFWGKFHKWPWLEEGNPESRMCKSCDVCEK